MNLIEYLPTELFHIKRYLRQVIFQLTVHTVLVILLMINYRIKQSSDDKKRGYKNLKYIHAIRKECRIILRQENFFVLNPLVVHGSSQNKESVCRRKILLCVSLPLLSKPVKIINYDGDQMRPRATAFIERIKR